MNEAASTTSPCLDDPDITEELQVDGQRRGEEQDKGERSEFHL